MASMPGITCTAHGPWWGPMINYIVAAIVTAYALIRLSGGGFLFEFVIDFTDGKPVVDLSVSRQADTSYEFRHLAYRRSWGMLGS
ncbi:hypothetical protein HFD88_008577 [Aspergillus terreus]|nr:hypothetical protein HFD88_008577 [Aspergillus terreus]